MALNGPSGDCGCGGCPGCKGKGLGTVCEPGIPCTPYTLPELDLSKGAPPVGLQPGWSSPPLVNLQREQLMVRAFSGVGVALGVGVLAGGIVLSKKHRALGPAVTALGGLWLAGAAVQLIRGRALFT